MWKWTELILSQWATKKALDCHSHGNAGGSFSTQNTSEMQWSASLFNLTCVFSTPLFLRSCEQLCPGFFGEGFFFFSRVRFHTGKRGTHQHSSQPKATQTHGICLGGGGRMCLWSGKLQVDRAGNHITKQKIPNGLRLPVRFDFIRMEDNGGKDDHSVGQDPFRVMSNHFRDTSSSPLPPSHHLSAFV